MYRYLCTIKQHVIDVFLADHVMVDGHTEVTYVPWVRLTPASSSTDYWSYDGRYVIIHTGS